MWILRWLFFVILLFFLVGFLSQNSDQIVSVRLLGWQSPDIPLSYSLIVAALAGYVICLLVATINQLRLRSQIAALRRESRAQQIELDRLRNFAIEDDAFPSVKEETA